MDIKQAVDIVKQIASMYKGTLEEHNAIQQAIKVIEANVSCNEESNVK